MMGMIRMGMRPMRMIRMMGVIRMIRMIRRRHDRFAVNSHISP